MNVSLVHCKKKCKRLNSTLAKKNVSHLDSTKNIFSLFLQQTILLFSRFLGQLTCSNLFKSKVFLNFDSKYLMFKATL